MNETTTCIFCEQLSTVKETNEWYQVNSPRYRDCWTEYKVALRTESYTEGIDWRTGACIYPSMDLNFCPVCGRDLRGEN